jgi:UrcA family protein
MLITMLLSLAAATGATDSNPIIVVDDRPSIRIGLDGYDLRREQDLRRLDRKIRWAAGRVCVRGYGVALYLERVTCVKGAIDGANQQLSQIIATSRPAVPLAATIGVIGLSK